MKYRLPLVQITQLLLQSAHMLARRSREVGVSVLALAPLCVAGCVQATADVPELEVTRQKLAFAAAPAIVPSGTVLTVTQQFTNESEPVKLPDSVSADVHATEFSLTIRDGADNLAFVRAAKLSATRKGGTPETIIDYASDGSETSKTLVLPIEDKSGALDPWSINSTTFEIRVTGELPRQVWHADVSLKYSGSISYSP